MMEAKFKYTEIGKIPEEWDILELGELGEFRNGVNFNSKDFGKGFPLINVKNLFRGRYATIDDLDEIKDGTIRNIESYRLQKEDILFARSSVKRSGAGQVAMVCNLPSKNTLFSGFIIRFRNNSYDKLNNEYLNYLLRSDIYREYLTRIATGTTITNLSQDNLSKIPILLPPLEDQRAIASILCSLDDKIALNRSMNTTLEAIGQALFRRWFVDFEFPDKEGRPYKSSGGEMVETELGEVPAGWKIKDIYSCAEYINGEAFRNGDFSLYHSGLPIIKIVELKNGITSQTEFTNRDVDSKYKINNGDILFSWSGSPDTSIDTFIWTGGSGWLNQHIFKVTPHSPHEKQFVYFLLQYHKKTFIEIARDKQTTGLGHVTIKDLKRMLFVIPPIKIMEQFENVASPLFNNVLCNYLESSTLSQIRDALLPKLLSGEIRVKGS
jgi:type I restriction enzyme S subunit